MPCRRFGGTYREPGSRLGGGAGSVGNSGKLTRSSSSDLRVMSSLKTGHELTWRNRARGDVMPCKRLSCVVDPGEGGSSPGSPCFLSPCAGGSQSEGYQPSSGRNTKKAREIVRGGGAA
jgi:hypothetical protein